MASSRQIREHEVQRILKDKERHRISQIVIGWVFCLIYNDPQKIGRLIRLIEDGKHEEVLRLTGGIEKLFMLMGFNHSWNANWLFFLAHPNDPNFRSLKCNVFKYFQYKITDHEDVQKLQIVSMLRESVYWNN